MSDDPTVPTHISAEEAEIKYPGPRGFVHLHVHTIFSALDGIASPEDYVKRCVELGMPAIGITDHGCLASFPDAYIAAKKHKVKFIPGCEIYYNHYHKQMIEFQASGITWAALKDTDPEKYDRYRRQRHITVLAKNEIGYKNLIHMTSNAWEIGFYYKPRIWLDILDKHREGLIILTGCMNSPICYEIRGACGAARQNMIDEANRLLGIAKDRLKDLCDIFKDDLYLEMQMPGKDLEWSRETFAACARMSRTHNVKSVITNDCHYISPEDFEVQRCMMAVDQNKTIDDPELFIVNSNEQFFKTRAQLRMTFMEHGYNKSVDIEKFEESCENTLEVASKCTGFKPDTSPKLPTIPNANNQLAKLVMTALEDKGFLEDTKQYLVDGSMVTHRQQTELELKRIIKKGFASYFLITRDLVRYSKESGWDVGPARGSAGGSLVCYLLGIHSLNPLKWGLSFDRFMSPARGGHLLKVTME